jgi:hypothetical protein
MPVIVDIISPVLAECFTFTPVAAPPDYVVSVGAGAPAYGVNGSGNSTFAKGDSISLLSAGFIIQESFTLFKNALFASPFVTVAFVPYGAVSGHAFAYQNLGSGQQVFIPMDTYEQVLDTFLNAAQAIDTIDPTKTLLDENYKISLYFAIAPYISMLGVPAGVLGKTFYICPFLKVAHTYPMV